MSIFNNVWTNGGFENMPSVESNYKSANTFVKSVEQSVNKSKMLVSENKSDSIFAVLPSTLEKSDVINKKYEISGDVPIKNVLEEWTAIIELRKSIRMDSITIENEVKKIEEEFRKRTSL